MRDARRSERVPLTPWGVYLTAAIFTASVTTVAFQRFAWEPIYRWELRRYPELNLAIHFEESDARVAGQLMGAFIWIPLVICFLSFVLGIACLVVWRGPWWWAAMNASVICLFVLCIFMAGERFADFID